MCRRASEPPRRAVVLVVPAVVVSRNYRSPCAPTPRPADESHPKKKGRVFIFIPILRRVSFLAEQNLPKNQKKGTTTPKAIKEYIWIHYESF